MKDLIEAIRAKREELSFVKHELEVMENKFLLAAEAAVKDAYKEKADPFGTAHVNFDGVKVKFTAPKKITWDQEALSAISAAIKEAGEDPLDYVKVSYEVSETKYNAWPEDIRAAFEPARTVAPGKMRFEFEGDE